MAVRAHELMMNTRLRWWMRMGMMMIIMTILMVLAGGGGNRSIRALSRTKH